MSDGQGQHEGCREWLTERRQGVHDLMERLLGRCTCESSTDHVHRLYGVEGTRSEERVSA